MIASRDNPRVKRWVRLARDSALRRRESRALVEGPHLVGEALAAGVKLHALLVSRAGLQREEIRKLAGSVAEPVVLSDAVFGAIAEAQTPPGIAAEIEIPQAAQESRGDCVFLEGVQDPSNVGALLRSAAAFGVRAVVLDRACADPWSPKALRAGMGAHFRLALRQVADLAPALEQFPGRVVCTVLAGGVSLREADLGGRLGWVFGGEARGVSPAAAAQAALAVTVPMAAGTESLNVAAAAAVCLYETYCRRLGSPGPKTPGLSTPADKS